MSRTSLLCVLAASWVWLASQPASAADQDALKREALQRLAASHDPAIPVAVGRVYLKQLGLAEARGLLVEAGAAAHLGNAWGPGQPEWQAAEARLAVSVDAVIAARLEDAGWLREAWAQSSAAVLDAEEADTIASHFATEGGAKQREVIEMLIVGETLLAYYTFTDRVRPDVRGSDRELSALQAVWWDREPFKVRDFAGYPGAMQFASTDPGVKYCKMLAIQGIEAINRHYDAVAHEIRAALRRAQPDIEPYLAQFRSRNGMN